MYMTTTQAHRTIPVSPGMVVNASSQYCGVSPFTPVFSKLTLILSSISSSSSSAAKDSKFHKCPEV